MSAFVETRSTRILIVGVLLVWFSLILVGNFRGIFRPGPDEPPLNLLLAALIPVAVFAISYVSFAGFRRFVLSLDLRLITLLQGWRVVGAGFLFLYAFDILPGLFALPAGWIDIAVGVAAPFFAMSLISGKTLPKWRFVTWNLLGIFDFVIAFTLGILAGGGPLGILTGEITTSPLSFLPLSLIPTFAVPLFAILHLIALIQVSKKAEVRIPEPDRHLATQMA